MKGDKWGGNISIRSSSHIPLFSQKRKTYEYENYRCVLGNVLSIRVIFGNVTKHKHLNSPWISSSYDNPGYSNFVFCIRLIS